MKTMQISCETRLPEALKQIRGSLSQAKFSAQIGLKQTTYSAWETGKKEPSLSVLAGIAKHFGVTTDWLLGLSDSRGVSITATDHSVAANNSTVQTPQECATLLRIIESQQRVIEKLAGGVR